MSKKTAEEPQSQSVNLRIRWQVPDDAPAGYATNFALQRMQHEYLLSFFQIQPPLILGTPDEVVEQVSHLDGVPARLISQVIIAEDRLPELLEMLANAGNLAPASAGPMLSQTDITTTE